MTPFPSAFIGVDLGGTNVRAGRVGRGLDAYASMGLRDTGHSEVVLDDICATIDQVLTPEVKAIGIGVPSMVDPVKGIVYAVTNIPSWQEVPLKALLEAKYRLPVHVNNDANCFALGEYHFGQGRGSQYLVGLILGTGLGVGLMARGSLVLGAHCGAGEIGNLPFRGHTVEHFISGPMFERVYDVDGQTLLERAHLGDQAAQQAFSAFGTDLGWLMKTILFAYDPDTILLGGSVSKAFPFFEGAMRSAMGDFAYPHVLSDLRILPTQEAHMPILGAAALCLDAAS